MDTPKTITLQNHTIAVVICTPDDSYPYLRSLDPVGHTQNGSEGDNIPLPKTKFLPLVNVRLTGEGNNGWKGQKSLVGSYISERFRYKSHKTYITSDDSETLDLEMRDEKTGITVTSHLTIFEGLPMLRATATVLNDSDRNVVLTQLTSVVVSQVNSTPRWWEDCQLSTATSTWFREAQWQQRTLPDIGLDSIGIHELPEHHPCSQAYYSLSNTGTFSTQGHLPMGLLTSKNDAWIWQVENNGSWRWDLGDFENGVYVAVSGPEASHDWRQRLAPGESFTSCPAAVGHVRGDQETAFAALTQYRRRIRRHHKDFDDMPTIFNDYMNCLMGDPTTEKILSLADPVAKSGAQYFVIDCGWYADDMGWWYDVGDWQPSKKRFPGVDGFKNLLRKLADMGLKPGLWIEPEVVGYKSAVAHELPNEAFFQRDGERVLERGRYQLDYRHPAVIERMDKIIDQLVLGYGARYFKFDYNIEVSQGTDVNCSSAGVGLLGHNRAYLKWVSGLLDRHPGLVIENCSSGAQRMDYAMLSVHTLQSTSDQQDPVRYAAIAAAIPTAVTPEQGATWAYPQGDWSDEINAMTVVNSLLGRIHLSGRLDQMSEKQLEIVYEGMRVYQDIRHDLPECTPFWPLGLPKWHDDWVSLGMMTADRKKAYVSVWRRGGDEVSCNLSIRAFEDLSQMEVKLLYPAAFEGQGSWSQSGLQVTLPKTQCARLFQVAAKTSVVNEKGATSRGYP
ncbi:Uu.00g073230.m01.CDS01 [Anthostomella pinea]|uniref:alpha-galactosidase n=1 Tax=Anthostomella pinea TaxID=933095 RepID=A0AAI8VWF8_9PEZI|nr:Uu.00g073230.m01.CDS01 [Anthostomella pinea]